MKKESRDARLVYADIIHLPHHQSTTRRHMSLYDRAAQFAPFAALTGYDEMVEEEARLTDRQKELSETELAALNRRLALLERLIGDGVHPVLTLTYFESDDCKPGGRYITKKGTVKKIDTLKKEVILFGSEDTEDRRVPVLSVSMDKIIHIGGLPPEYDFHTEP